MAIRLGKAFVEVVPSFVGFPRAVENGVAQATRRPAQVAVDGDTKGLTSKVSTALNGILRRKNEVKLDADASGAIKSADEAGRKGGAGFARTFVRQWRSEADKTGTWRVTSLTKAWNSPEVSGAASDAGKKFGQRLTSAFKRETDQMGDGLGASLEKVGKGGKGGGLLGMIGAGGLLGAGAGLVSELTSQLSEYASGAVAASDATDKFKQTLQFAGLKTDVVERLGKSSQDYADKTVYELSDIQQVTAQLAANHVKDFDKMAEAMGNLNAVAGGNAETFSRVGMAVTQTAGAGKLTTENWNQIADAIPGASGILQEAMKKNGAFTGNFRDAMAKGQITADEFNKALQQVGSTDVAKKAATSTKTMEGAWGNFQATMTGGLAKIITAIKPFLTSALGMASNLIGPVFGGISNGIGKVVGWAGKLKTSNLWAGLTMSDKDAKGIGAPLDGAVAAGRRMRSAFDQLKNWFQGTFAPAFSGVASQFSGLWSKALQIGGQFVTGLMARIRPMYPQIKATFSQIGQAIMAAMGLIRGVISAVTTAISFIWSRWGNSIIKFAAATFKNVLSLGQGFFKVLTGIFKVLSSVLRGDWSGAWKGIKQIAAGGWQMVKAIFSQAWVIIKAGWKLGISVLKGGFSLLWEGLKSLASAGWSWLRSKTFDPMVRFFTRTIPDAARRAKDGFGRQWDGLKKKASQPVKAIVDTVWNNGIVALAGKAGLGKAFKKVNFKGFREGGFTGAGPADQAAGLVHAGEYVLTKSETRRMGGPAGVEAWKHALPGFKSGGYVGGSGSLTSLAASKVQAAAGSLGWMFQLAQQGWRPATSYSGTSHAGDAVDVSGPAGGTRLWSVRDALRRQNWAAWVRGPKQGFSWHVHAVPGPGAGTPKGSAVYQWSDYLNGGNGLRGSGQSDPYATPSGSGGSWLGKLSSIWAGIKGGVGAVVNKLGQTWDVFKGKIGSFAHTKLPGAAPWLDSVKSVPGKLVSAAQTKLKSVWDNLFGGGDAGTEGAAGGGPARAVIQRMAAARGWTGNEWGALNWIINHESSWDPNSKNPRSTARGLFQLLYEPGTNTPYRQHPVDIQGRDGLNYIRGRYGTPSRAKAFWQAHNWYDDGGMLPNGPALTMNKTGKVEPVFTSNQWASIDKIAGVGLSTLTAGVGKVSAGLGTATLERPGKDERYELTITNWKEGTGVVRRVAADEAQTEYDWRNR